ncbi:MAG: hypothetical protein U0132_09730 [Gemmatimonadaceae bacterium]
MIQQLKRPTEAIREARAREERRQPLNTLTSVILHIVLAVVFWNALKIPAAFERMFLNNPASASRPKAERLTYVTVPTRGRAAVSQNSIPAPTVAAPPPQPSAPPLVSPREVPATLPPVTRGPAINAPPGPASGPLITGRGVTAGAQPSYQDPRIWSATEGPLVNAPKSSEERLDSAVVASVKKFQDSVAIATHQPNKFERGDWTVEKNGKKYGIDQQYIRLGKFSIPTPLLALLPFNRVQANPIAAEESRRQLAMRADIMEHAQAAMNEEEFRRAVKAIRERKEREKRNQAEPVAVVRRRTDRGVVAPSERPPQ